jgi:peptide/nickel transport system permease protein
VTRYIVRKLIHVVVVLLVVSFALTFLLDLAPGDPALALIGDQATPDQIAQVHKDLHLDDPILERYGRWLSGILHGDFGVSYQTKEKVSSLIAERLPVTAEIVLLAIGLALLIAVPLGIYTAFRADGVFDRVWMVVSSALISVPPFLSALVLVYFFAVRARDSPIHFPATGWSPLQDGLGENLWYLVLPVVALALVEIPSFARLLRADMMATLQEDFILAARARGVPTGRILLRHAFRPSTMSLITFASLSIARLIGGAVIVETLFSLPGLGQLTVQSIFSKDVLVVQGVAMFVAIAYVVINAVVDIGYSLIDPRVRMAGTDA